jgi:hypothetical protein
MKKTHWFIYLLIDFFCIILKIEGLRWRDCYFVIIKVFVIFIFLKNVRKRNVQIYKDLEKIS